MDFAKLMSMRNKTGVLALAVKGTSAELLVYDVIGEDFFGDGVSAESVVRQLASLPDTVDTILVRINSPGGNVAEGLAIFNALVTHPAKVNVQIDALAASMASVIAMAGDSITIAPTGIMMIHNAWGIVGGDGNKLREIAAIMDKHSEQMAVAYRRSGIATEQIRSIMDTETWYTAEEALAAGWVNSVMEMPTKKPAAKARYDLSAFAHVPDKLKAAADTDCTCPCPPCVAGNCAGCTDEDCACVGCTCESAETSAKAQKKAAATASASLLQAAELSASVRSRQLRLAQQG